MNLLKRLFLKKEEVIECVDKYGMEVAVQEYGIIKLIEYGILLPYEDTALFYDSSALYQKVYNERGEYLGDATDLMAPYYKTLGRFWGPCLNGNIILSKVDQEKGCKTYGVFDQHAEILINYGTYCDKVFLDNSVALRAENKDKKVKVITINPQGIIKHQPFIYIEESYLNDNNEMTFTVTLANEDKTEQIIKENDLA